MITFHLIRAFVITVPSLSKSHHPSGVSMWYGAPYIHIHIHLSYRLSNTLPSTLSPRVLGSSYRQKQKKNIHLRQQIDFEKAPESGNVNLKRPIFGCALFVACSLSNETSVTSQRPLIELQAPAPAPLHYHPPLFFLHLSTSSRLHKVSRPFCEESFSITPNIKSTI